MRVPRLRPRREPSRPTRTSTSRSQVPNRDLALRLNRRRLDPLPAFAFFTFNSTFAVEGGSEAEVVYFHGGDVRGRHYILSVGRTVSRFSRALIRGGGWPGSERLS